MSSGVISLEPGKDPCKHFACELQYCLQRFNYNSKKCDHILENLRECCLRNYFKKDANNTFVSDTCSGFVPSN